LAPVPARIHHLNCGTMCPWGRRFVNGDGGLFENAKMICHVLLVEGADGLVLIDTGYGTNDIAKPRQLGRPFNALIRPQLVQAETAVSQVRALGFDPADVRHVVVTHLDLDHAGGLSDFPGAEVHLFAAEHEAAMKPSWRARSRYIPAHWAHGPRWVTHRTDGDEWLGFESVRILPGADPDVLLIPLPGHTRGHTGVAVRRSEGWLLHCGDAYFHHGDIETPRACPPGLRIFQNLTQVDGKLRQQNRERLAELAGRHADEVELVCAHDPVELERAQARG
jgi:glyoxylase-like metal-dependent hydrolase (beta-lactamase superfamily II)